jgi:hypothetical protein
MRGSSGFLACSGKVPAKSAAAAGMTIQTRCIKRSTEPPSLL